MEPRPSQQFQDLVAQAARALEDRGLSVLSAAVAGVIDGLIASAIERTGISRTEALRLVVPEQVAEWIILAGWDERHASIRPLREDTADAVVPSTAAGQLINALSQAAKMAVTNGDKETAVHAVDLLSEFGVGISSASPAARVSVHRGVLSETAQILDRVAEAFESRGWSTCPCGEDHGQQNLDQGLPLAFRTDAEMARQLLLGDLAKGDCT
jgi:hypothetical protein